MIQFLIIIICSLEYKDKTSQMIVNKNDETLKMFLVSLH